MRLTIFALYLFLVIFDLNAKIIYTEPVRNAKYVSIENNIIIGFDERIISSDLNSLISVKGTLSGNHSGEIIVTPDRKKLIFKPSRSFAFGEQVEVRLNRLRTSFNSRNDLYYIFQTQSGKPQVEPGKFLSEGSEDPDTFSNYRYSGDYSALPGLTVTVSNNPSPGHLFLSNFQTGIYTPHLMIANNDGSLFYFREMERNAVDYNRQANGLMVYYFSKVQKYFAEDTSYNIVDSFYCGNGYTTDTHDLRILNNGHALLMSYDPEPVDMSAIVPGGDPNAIVTGLIIQEIDENKNVVFQWRSWDHFSITDASYVNLTLPVIDYVHGNAVDLDNDGNLLISSRHLSEITKISRTTGDIIWRMGGVNNQFTFVNDTIPFHYQHNIRRLSNGNVTLFDNGNFRTPLFSRAVEYQLDEINKIATLVWQYRNTPDIYGAALGSVQRLQNGNTLICWGQANPNIMEVTPAGEVALKMSLPQNVNTYRVFRDEVKLTLNLKLAPEGFYNVQTNRLNMNDTVTALLREINSPYNIIDSLRSVIDSVNLNANFRFYDIHAGTCYISVRHRNSLETWSKSGGESFASGGVFFYDFTSSELQAYGENLVHRGSKYCIYGGDVNQDGSIDAADLSMVDNSAYNYVSGYVSEDVDGNRIVDALDLIVAERNADNFVMKITPP